MRNYPKLEDVVIPNDGSVPDVRIADLPFIQISRDVRLWYQNREKAFYFYSGRWAGAAGYGDPTERDIWKMPDVEIECLFHGVAYYDGVRHLYMGDKASDNEGYLYYFDVRDGVKIFQALDRLEGELLEPEMHHRT